MSQFVIKKKRGDLTRILLESISEFAGNASDNIAAFLTAGYGASVNGLEYEARKHRRARLNNKAVRDEEQKLRQRYHVMLHSLKKAGLVIERKRGNEKFLTVTHRGEIKLGKLKKEFSERLTIPSYKLETGNPVIIVAFDIPETDRNKRDWLRSVLKNLGLKMIQQSLWVGKGILPRDFLEDLRKANLIDFVEIFEVTKSGTLGHSV